MIAFNRRTRVYVSKSPEDMRLSYNGLCARVKSVLQKDVYSGHLFLFVNKRGTSCKCLYYDGTGFVIIMKRLERGRFARMSPLFRGEITLTASELGLFLEGAQLDKRFIESPAEVCVGRGPQDLHSTL
jgi:transposase